MWEILSCPQAGYARLTGRNVCNNWRKKWKAKDCFFLFSPHWLTCPAQRRRRGCHNSYNRFQRAEKDAEVFVYFATCRQVQTYHRGNRIRECVSFGKEDKHPAATSSEESFAKMSVLALISLLWGTVCSGSGLNDGTFRNSSHIGVCDPGVTAAETISLSLVRSGCQCGYLRVLRNSAHKAANGWKAGGDASLCLLALMVLLFSKASETVLSDLFHRSRHLALGGELAVDLHPPSWFGWLCCPGSSQSYLPEVSSPTKDSIKGQFCLWNRVDF